MKTETGKRPSGFEKISSVVTKATGSTAAFTIALFVIISWLICGPIFNFSNTWQLVVNTGTTIITFLMVFLIQRSQNKDSVAIHLKLNELLVAHEFASNRLVAVEDISEEELIVLKKFYRNIALMTREEMTILESHSRAVANAHHVRKQERQKKNNTKA